jgi:hypothetical protein
MTCRLSLLAFEWFAPPPLDPPTLLELHSIALSTHSLSSNKPSPTLYPILLLIIAPHMTDTTTTSTSDETSILAHMTIDIPTTTISTSDETSILTHMTIDIPTTTISTSDETSNFSHITMDTPTTTLLLAQNDSDTTSSNARQYFATTIELVNGWTAFRCIVPIITGTFLCSPTPHSSLTALESSKASRKTLTEILQEETEELPLIDDGDPNCYPGTGMLRPPWDPAPKSSPKKRQPSDETTTPTKKLKVADSDSDLSSPPPSPCPSLAPRYSREVYTEEKDTMIRFLRDDLENTWEEVARLYNEYWESDLRTRKLSRRYAVVVPKVQQGKKKVGRLTTGDKAMGVKGNGESWAWMESWEKSGKLR